MGIEGVAPAPAAGIDKRPVTTMQDGEQYNRASQLQQTGHSVTYPTLRESCRRVLAACADARPVRVLDVACAGGANSITTQRQVVAELRAAKPGVEVQVFHEDQPTNDFGPLFKRLRGDQSYLADGVWSCAIGADMYTSLVPPGQMHLSVAYSCVHWLSSLPCPIPGPRFSARDAWGLDQPHAHTPPPPELLAKWETAAHEDLVRFLTLRATELAAGGELLFTHAMPGDAKPIVLPYFAEAMGELARDGVLTEQELELLTPCYLLREEAEIRAAAADARVAPHLTLRSLDVHEVPYPQEPPHSAAALDAVAEVFWAVHGPGVTEALARRGGEGAGEALRRLRAAYRRRLDQLRDRRFAARYAVAVFTRRAPISAP